MSDIISNSNDNGAQPDQHSQRPSCGLNRPWRSTLGIHFQVDRVLFALAGRRLTGNDRRKKMTSTFTSIFDQVIAGDVGLGFFGVCCAALGVGLGLASYGVSLAASRTEAERKIGRSMLFSAGFQIAVLAVALMSGLWQMAGIGVLVAAYVFWLIRKKKEPIKSATDQRP